MPDAARGTKRPRVLSVALGWRNLMQNRKRTLTALGGIVFAVVLVFMQLGFLLAARRGAVLLYEDFEFDIAILSDNYQSVTSLGRFPRARLAQIESVPGVAAVGALRILVSTWINPENGEDSKVMILGVPDDPTLVRNAEMRAGVEALGKSDNLLADRLSHPDMGNLDTGTEVEVGGAPFRIVGQFSEGMSMFSEGAGAVGTNGLERISRGSASMVSIGLVRLTPGADGAEILRTLRASLPADVILFDRATLLEREQDYFTTVKPVGIVFKVGVFVALAVGVVILYQVLSTEVSTRLKEYATMKSLGFGNRFIYRIGVAQALLFGLLSFVPAGLISAGIYSVVRTLSRLPMKLTPGLLSLVFGLSLGMCVISCVMALGKVRKADPAELF